MDENEAHELSCQIEPTHPNSSSANVSKESRFKRRITPIINHRKNDSIASTVSGSSSSSTPMLCETDGSVKEEDLPDGKLSVSSCLNDSIRSRLSSGSSLSTPSLDTSLVNSSPSKCDKTEKPASDPYKTPDFYIIRVSWETSSEATEGVIMYKSIMLSNREHTREVICSAMLKHGIEGSPDDYTLSQVLPDKGLYYRETFIIKIIDCKQLQSYKFLPMPMYTTPSTPSMTSTLCCDPEEGIFPRTERRRLSCSRTQLRVAKGTPVKLVGSSSVLPCDSILHLENATKLLFL